MNFLLRCLVLSLAAFGVAALVSSAVVALAWWQRAPGTQDETPPRRADALLRLRLVPAVLAAGAGLFAIVGLWRFESRDTDEVIGWTLRAGATCGVVYLALFAARVWKMALETRRLLDAWLVGATPITLPDVTVPAFRIHTGFPVVAVVGILHPTLVVDAAVLNACSPDELAAILAHEHGHLRRWDNLRRALFAATPDLLAGTPAGRDLRHAWREATEEAADDVAAERGEAVRVHLAAALLRVARLAPATATHPAATFHGAQLPASALYRGESVERRVRRLCAGPAPAPRPRPHWGVALRTPALTLAFSLQEHVHDAMEMAVALLP